MTRRPFRTFCVCVSAVVASAIPESAVAIARRNAESVLIGVSVDDAAVVSRRIAERDAAAEVRRQLHFRERAREQQLGDLRAFAGTELRHQWYRLVHRGPHAVQLAERDSDRAVVEPDGALVHFIVLDEGRRGSPFVGQQTAEEPRALRIRWRCRHPVVSRQRWIAPIRTASAPAGGVDVFGLHDVRVDDLEQRAPWSTRSRSPAMAKAPASASERPRVTNLFRICVSMVVSEAEVEAKRDVRRSPHRLEFLGWLVVRLAARSDRCPGRDRDSPSTRAGCARRG